MPSYDVSRCHCVLVLKVFGVSLADIKEDNNSISIASILCARIGTDHHQILGQFMHAKLVAHLIATRAAATKAVFTKAGHHSLVMFVIFTLWHPVCCGAAMDGALHRHCKSNSLFSVTSLCLFKCLPHLTIWVRAMRSGTGTATQHQD